MKDPPEKPVLDYRKPENDLSGCRPVIRETVAGFFQSGFLYFVANIALPSLGEKARIPVFVILISTFFAIALFRAWKRHPGYLIGFLLATGCLGSLASTCGFGPR